MKKGNLIMGPINAILNELDDNSSSVLLLGEPGSGKSTILKEYLKTSNDKKWVIDTSIKLGEYPMIWNENSFNLYHTALIVNKILLHIEKMVPILSIHIMYFKIYIENILKQLNFMQVTLNYDDDELFIDKEVIKRPEILIDELLRLISKYLDINKLIVVLDDFDRIGESSRRYQEFIYNRVKEYLNVIITVSDLEAIQDSSVDYGDNKIIRIDYSRKTETVKDILDKEIVRIMLNKKLSFSYRIRFTLSDSCINEIILRTNGNLFDMLKAIRALYNDIENIPENQYEEFILNYIDEVINADPRITGIIIPTRKFHISQNKKITDF